MKTLLSILLLALFAAPVSAQSPRQYPYERVLIPLDAPSHPLHGAYGSLWLTQLVIRNEADAFVDVTHNPGGIAVTLPPGYLPHSSFGYEMNAVNPNAGYFMSVGNPGLGKVKFMLRVQDISRQAQTWGTQIPVVREKDVYTDKLQLLNIPVDSHFRSTLRIYDFDSLFTDKPGAVRVRIYDMCGIGTFDHDCSNVPLVDVALSLTGPGFSQPATAMISDLVAAFPQLAAVPPTQLLNGTRPATVRIDIDPITPGLRFWAFVTATNNETQHVTAIAPE